MGPYDCRRRNAAGILRDLRGDYKRISFYENYEQLGIEAKMFDVEQISKKSCSFNVLCLAKFVGKVKFYFNHFTSLQFFSFETFILNFI
jgi:hypothetical protein